MSRLEKYFRANFLQIADTTQKEEYDLKEWGKLRRWVKSFLWVNRRQKQIRKSSWKALKKLSKSSLKNLKYFESEKKKNQQKVCMRSFRKTCSTGGAHSKVGSPSELSWASVQKLSKMSQVDSGDESSRIRFSFETNGSQLVVRLRESRSFKYFQS